jgi:hypothetical protein
VLLVLLLQQLPLLAGMRWLPLVVLLLLLLPPASANQPRIQV